MDAAFRGKVLAITGAGSGIGRALASLGARSGAELALSDVNAPGLAETAEQVREAKARARAAGRPWPNLVDNVTAMRTGKKGK